MTDKLHCPFCGAELERCSYLSKGITNPVFVCRNRKCKFVDKIIGSEIWQALIDGKKAQEALNVATEALSKIDAFNCHSKGAMEVIAGMASIANGALYEITSITKQEE